LSLRGVQRSETTWQSHVMQLKRKLRKLTSKLQYVYQSPLILQDEGVDWY